MTALYRFSHLYIATTANNKKMFPGEISRKTKEIDPDSKGVSRTAIINIITGRSKPSADTLAMICAALDISPKSVNLWIPVENQK